MSGSQQQHRTPAQRFISLPGAAATGAPAMINADDEDWTELEEQAKELGEDFDGRISMSSSSAHPFMNSCMTLQYVLGFYAALAVLVPMLIQWTLDPAFVHQVMFDVLFVIFLFTIPLFKDATDRLLWIYIRAYKLQAESRMGGRIPGAFAAISLSIVVQLIVSEIEAYTGELHFYFTWTIAFVTLLLTVIAILLIGRQKRLIIIDNVRR
jgi:hypothetical protein